MAKEYDWAQGDPEYPALLAAGGAALDATEAVALALEKRGVTQSQLAALCGVTRGAISQRLKGTSNMTIRNLGQMLHHLGYTLQIELVDAQTGETFVTRDHAREIRGDGAGLPSPMRFSAAPDQPRHVREITYA